MAILPLAFYWSRFIYRNWAERHSSITLSSSNSCPFFFFFFAVVFGCCYSCSRKRILFGLFFTRISAPSDTILIGEQSNWTSANATDNTASRWVGEFMGGWHDLPSKDKIIIIITTTGGLNIIIWLLLVVIDHHRGPLLWSNERYWRFTAYLIVICTRFVLIQFFSHFFFSCLPL